jgi:hypothetical protein
MKPTKPIPTHPGPWTAAPPAATARTAFAKLATPLGRADERLLEAALFDGHGCTELARCLGVEAAAVRRRLGAAMLALHGALIGEPGEGAVAALLALHALDALDPDEAALVDTMLAHQPALRHIHDGYCELVGELCLRVARVAPPPCPIPSCDAAAN